MGSLCKSLIHVRPQATMRRQAQEGHRAVTQVIRERVLALLAASEAPSVQAILEAAVGSCLVASAQALVAVRGSNAGCADDGACRQYGAEEQVCCAWPRDCMQVCGLCGKGRLAGMGCARCMQLRHTGTGACLCVKESLKAAATAASYP